MGTITFSINLDQSRSTELLTVFFAVLQCCSIAESSIAVANGKQQYSQNKFALKTQKGTTDIISVVPLIIAWRRPTLPGPCGPSTIGAGGLNGRVRDGYVWNPSAIATKRDFCTAFTSSICYNKISDLRTNMQLKLHFRCLIT